MTAHIPSKDLIPSLQRKAMSVLAPLQREFNRFFDDLGESFGVLTEASFAPRMDVLTVEIPKRPDAETKTIEIQSK